MSSKGKGKNEKKINESKWSKRLIDLSPEINQIRETRLYILACNKEVTHMYFSGKSFLLHKKICKVCCQYAVPEIAEDDDDMFGLM